MVFIVPVAKQVGDGHDGHAAGHFHQFQTEQTDESASGRLFQSQGDEPITGPAVLPAIGDRRPPPAERRTSSDDIRQRSQLLAQSGTNRAGEARLPSAAASAVVQLAQPCGRHRRQGGRHLLPEERRGRLTSSVVFRDGIHSGIRTHIVNPDTFKVQSIVTF